jgi:hypothetical protein
LYPDRIFRLLGERAGITFQLTVVLALVVTGAEGQEKQYQIGPSIDVVSGSDSHPLSPVVGTSPQTSSGTASFFRLYPAISLTTLGGQSALKASYALQLTGTRSDVAYNTLSHSASLAFIYPPTLKWKLNLTENFLASSDSASFNGLRGTSLPPDAFRFLFEPVQILTYNNNAGIVADYALDPLSTLSLTGSDNLRFYGNGATKNTTLYNQQFVTGGLNYTRKTSARDAWVAGYLAGYTSFQNLGGSTSHTVHVGYSFGIASDTKLDLIVGASQVGLTSGTSSNTPSGANGASGTNLGTASSYVGYNTSITLSKTKLNDTFSIRFRQDSGQPTGLGTVSDNRQAGVSVGHKVGTISLFVDASIFDSQGSLGNTLQLRGANGTASIGIQLTETLTVNGGFQYLRYAEPAPLGFTQQRFFVTLRYNDPQRWTIFR